jgi:peptide/nickel transport system permease protein
VALASTLRLVRTRWSRPVVQAFRRSPTGIVSLIVIAGLVLVAVVAPMTLGHRADHQDFGHLEENPSWHFPLGTDAVGRDIFVRLLVATRLSLTLAITAAGLGLAIGVAVGSLAALLGPRLRPVLLRVIDAMLSFPAILKAIFVSAILGAGTTSAIIGVAVAISFSYARITSTLALGISGREYINAARVLGVSRRRLMLRYVLPNIAEPLLVATSVAITSAIVQVSALSFLGLGVKPPDIDWGRMLTDGVKSIYLTPAAALGPAGAIAITALAFGFFGEALARALNPQLWTAPRQRGKPRPSDWAIASGDNSGSSGLAQMPADQSSNAVALAVRDLVITYPGADGPIDVVRGISFDVREGEIVGIVGESGSGKTMTALAVAQIVPHPGRVTGTIRLHGHELGSLPRKRLDDLLGMDLAVVFQNPLSSLNPALRIGSQLAGPLRAHSALGRKAATARAVAALREVHIAAPERQAHRYPHEFSGGMRQRAMIAKGLMKEPSLLIADEPTTALDVTIQAQIMDLLNEVNTRHRTAIVLISHNLALVTQNCHRVIVMYAGAIVEELPADRLVEGALHPYTRALIGAVAELHHPRGEALTYIAGETPDVSSLPGGCAFHPRCPLALGRCSDEVPLLLARDEGGRRVACHVANADLQA